MSKKRQLEEPEESKAKRLRLVKHNLRDLPLNPLLHIYTFLDAREHYRMGFVNSRTRGQWNASKYHHEGGVWDPRAWAPNLKAEKWMNLAGLWRIGCQRVRELNTYDLDFDEERAFLWQFQKTLTSVNCTNWSKDLEHSPLRFINVAEPVETESSLCNILSRPLVFLSLGATGRLWNMPERFPGMACWETLTCFDFTAFTPNESLILPPMANLQELELFGITRLARPLSHKTAPKLRSLFVDQEEIAPIFDQELALQLRLLWFTVGSVDEVTWDQVAPGVTQLPQLESYATDLVIPPCAMPKLRALWVFGAASRAPSLPQLANRAEYKDVEGFWYEARDTPLPDVPTLFMPPPSKCSKCKALSVDCTCPDSSESEDDGDDICERCDYHVDNCMC